MSIKKTKKTLSPKKKVTTTTTTVVTTITTEVEKNLDTHYLLILDRSGSMQSCWNSTIDGLNEQLGAIRALDEKYPEQRYFLTLVAFDDNIETIIEDKPISEVKDFTGNEFPPRGMTALHDAMGISISNLKARLEKNVEENSIPTALVVIMTDGGENSSKEHTSNSIKNLIDDLDKTGAWTFSYMGANQDAVLTASHFGISAGNSVTYSSTSSGATMAYATLNSAVSARAAATSASYTNSLIFGDVSIDTLKLSNDNFFSNVVDGTVIGEDDSNIKDENLTTNP